jgi:hypothetical protein
VHLICTGTVLVPVGILLNAGTRPNCQLPATHQEGVDLETDGDDLELLSALVQDHLNADGWAQN